jgi:peptidoglycan/xylan/chitin deacetylase (PgdA/CDA1 family)
MVSVDISFIYYPEGRKKALTMSYDDGQVFDRKLVEIFNKYGIKGTFHLSSGWLDGEIFLKASEIAELFKGHEVSAHSVNHPYLTGMPADIASLEVLEDRRRLEALVGYPVRGMSYPFGAYSKELMKTLPSLGIEYSRTVNSHGGFQLPDDFMEWHPTCHHNHNLMEKANVFKNHVSWAKMPLLYVWGHSFEFEREKNWDLIEEFCKLVSGDESTWYATNIEIMDYIKAIRGLRFSVDCTMVSNPSAIPVWIGVDGEPVKIGAGETVKL